MGSGAVVLVALLSVLPLLATNSPRITARAKMHKIFLAGSYNSTHATRNPQHADNPNRTCLACSGCATWNAYKDAYVDGEKRRVPHGLITMRKIGSICTSCKPGYGFATTSLSDTRHTGVCVKYERGKQKRICAGIGVEKGSWKLAAEAERTVCTKVLQAERKFSGSRFSNQTMKAHFLRHCDSGREGRFPARDCFAYAKCSVWKEAICGPDEQDNTSNGSQTCRVTKNVACLEVCKFHIRKDPQALEPFGCDANQCDGVFGETACKEVAILA